MLISKQGTGVLVKGVKNFSLANTLECGQCFRWRKIDKDTYKGVVGDKCLTISQKGDSLFLHNIGLKEFEFWRDYFDLNRDYTAIHRLMAGCESLKPCVDFAQGIRILKGQPWETLCSFIISQNNNIPRIKGIIERLCRKFGVPLDCGKYAFPDAHRLAVLSEEDLTKLGCGFRAKYIIDAAKKVSCGIVDFKKLRTMPIEEARRELMTIKGVGPKVAECVLLYGLHRLDAFPADVWIKRAMPLIFPHGLPKELAPYAGVAQQYIYHYARLCNIK